MRYVAAFFPLLALASPAVNAQDLSPALPPTDAAQSAVIDSINRNAERSAYRNQARRSGATQRQIAACSQKARLRAQDGANNPSVKKLYRLCRGIGM